MISSLIPLLPALGIFASYVSASAQAATSALVQSPSTITLPVTLSPSVPGGPTSEQTLTLTENPTFNGASPAFTTTPGGGAYPNIGVVPADNPPCSSVNAIVSSCDTLASWYVLPLTVQAQCLCNIGPWDSVVSVCYETLMVAGQYYASSLSSHGLLGVCSTYGLGPTLSGSVIASISATTTPVTATDTSIGTVKSSTGSATANVTRSTTQNPIQSSTQIAATGSGSSSLARPSLLMSLLAWLLAL
jgi:hypothetical protein